MKKKKRKLTAADVWAMFAETDRQLKEKSLEMAEYMKELGNKLKENKEKIDKFEDQLGGVSSNIGHHAEQFFQDVFKKKLEFGGMKYDEMIPNLTYKGKEEIEFDIALLNGDSIALIEVKNRIHPNFVDKFASERIEKFRKYFQEFSSYRAYLGIAGFSFSDEVLDRAGRYGIGIVKQVGEGVEIVGAYCIRPY